MNKPSEVKPKSLKRDHLVVEELGKELMIYDQTRNQAFCLNEKSGVCMAALRWSNLCSIHCRFDGKRFGRANR